MLAELYDSETDEQEALKKKIIDAVAGDIELRSKRELIEQFISRAMPTIESAAKIPDCFEECGFRPAPTHRFTEAGV